MCSIKNSGSVAAIFMSCNLGEGVKILVSMESKSF